MLRSGKSLREGKYYYSSVADLKKVHKKVRKNIFKYFFRF